MRLQCKYKLTEVSDLTFNELLVRQPTFVAPVAGDGREIQARKRLLGRRRLGSATADVVVAVSKLPDNRLSQSKCPAERNELQAALFAGDGMSRRPDAECRLGQLALQPDDPLIVELAHTETDSVSTSSSTLSEVENPDESDDDENRRRRRQVIGAPGLELSVGELISANCSTISALLLGADELATTGGRAGICSDAEARRRSLISGKYQTRAEQDSMANQRAPQQQQQQTHWTLRPISGRAQQQQQQQPPTSAKLSSQLMLTQRQFESLSRGHQQQRHEINDSRTTESSSSSGAESTLFLSGGFRSSETTTTAGQLEAPPLLEWFINNQEVS